MSFLWLGIILIVSGAILIFLGLAQNKRVNVNASSGSVAIGGDNSAPIFNMGNSTSTSPQTKSHGHGLTILGILVELVGIGVTLWHAFHLAVK